jgi:hypothetical protein
VIATTPILVLFNSPMPMIGVRASRTVLVPGIRSQSARSSLMRLAVFGALATSASAFGMDADRADGPSHCESRQEGSLFASVDPTALESITVTAVIRTPEGMPQIQDTCTFTETSLDCVQLGSSPTEVFDSTLSIYEINLTAFPNEDVVGVCALSWFGDPEPPVSQPMYKGWFDWYESYNDDADCNTMCQQKNYASGYAKSVNFLGKLIGGPFTCIHCLNCMCVTPGGNEKQIDMEDPDPGSPGGGIEE